MASAEAILMLTCFMASATFASKFYGSESDLQAIKEKMKQFSDLFYRKNSTEFFAKICTEDAVEWELGGDIYFGRDIIKYIDKLFESGVDREEWVNDYALVQGDLSIGIGHFEEDGVSGNVIVKGKSFTLWKRMPNSGDWKVFFDIYTK